MNDLNFACPHCGQQLACDENYAGSMIDCPACQRGILVPAEIASDPTGNPVTANASRYPRPRDPEFWTEEAWNRHVASMPGYRHQYGWPTTLLILLPIAVAWFAAPWVPRHWSLVPALWIAGTALCSVFATWQVVQPTSEDRLARLLWGIPIGCGILIMQLTLASAAGCCWGANVAPASPGAMR